MKQRQAHRNVRTAIEKWAREFHEAYERLAPDHGYVTRQDTRTFDPESKNGRLMLAVVGEVLGLVRNAALEEAKTAAVREVLAGGSGLAVRIERAIDALKELP